MASERPKEPVSAGSRLKAPSGDLAWLASPSRKSAVAVPCQLPGCRGKVDRSTGGRQARFHSRKCRRWYAERRTSLLAELTRIDRVLSDGSATTFDARRDLERDRAYLERVLSLFPSIDAKDA